MKRFFILSILLGIIIWPVFTYADKASELQKQIDSRQAEIAKLDQEIAAYQASLDATSEQSNTLASALKTLTLNLKKINANISKTKTQISSTKLEIDKLNLNITATNGDITDNRTSLTALLRQLRIEDQRDWAEALLGDKPFSDFWVNSAKLVNLEQAVYRKVQELQNLKVDLNAQVDEATAEKKKLESLSKQLVDQQKIAQSEQARQTLLLAQTKNKEANYKTLLAASRSKREAFAKELFDFESQLKLEIDRSKLPGVAHGILAWPVDKPQITQAFGKTVDAKRLYASGTHNGIDLRASIGTPIKSAASGVVAGTGDTDLTCRGASYGRWVLIKHDNGLATLYAHLSLIKAVTGQRVQTSDLIGYSGATGYATGPHLHFTVAAAQGVEVGTYKSKVCAGSYTMPVFDTRAYLDPVLYL